MDYTPAVLRNKGVPVRIARLEGEKGSFAQVRDSEGNVESEEFFVRFTHNTIADIEELWEGLPDWQDAMANKPISTLRRTFALLMGRGVEEAGLSLLEGELGTYNNAIGTAWALANGVDPTVASRLLAQAQVATESQITMLNEELKTTLAEAEEEQKQMKGTGTPGKKPSAPGAKRTKDSKTSGKPAPPKS
jgi:hypothetical protein